MPMRLHPWVWFGTALAAATALVWWVAAGRDAPAVDPTPGAVAKADLSGDLCIVAPPLPYDPTSGRAPLEAREIPAEARCPVCGMFPARAPVWAAQVIFDDGYALFLDSPLMLFLLLADVPRYAPGRDAASVAVRYVRDFGHGRWIDAASAHYVHGSRVLGPMRAGNLPAFADAERAAGFAREQGGSVLRAADIDTALLRSLDTRHDHAAVGPQEPASAAAR